jgi:hypothetical protein
MDTIDASITGRAPRAGMSADTKSTFDARGPPVAYTIAEFCYAHKISQASYYKQRKLGLGPKEMEFGRRRIISAEAAADWRRARVAADDVTA